MQLRGDDLLGEVQRVRPGQQREQPPLVHPVVEQQLLLVGFHRLELPPPHAVPHRDRQRDLRRVDARAADADPALDQGAQHREEAAVRVLDVAGVRAVLGHLREPVEQRRPRHPHAVEPQPAVVDAVEAELEAVVLDPYAGRRRPGPVPDRHHEGVDAPALAQGLQLREQHGHLGVPGGVADVVLAGLLAVGGDHELAGLGLVDRDRAEGLDVAPVARLGHREAAHQLPGDQVAQVGVVVRLGAELEDRAAEEPELDADLHQHRQVAERQGLERRHGRADVASAAVLLREAHPRLTGGRQLDDEVAHPVAVLVPRQRLGLLQHGGVRRQVAADEGADVGVPAVQQGREGGDVDLRRRTPRV